MVERTRLFVAGHNLSGYMPMSGPYLTTSWESARDCLAEDIDRYRDSLWSGLSMSEDKIFPLEEAEQWGATEILDWWFGGNDKWIPWSELNVAYLTERELDGKSYVLTEHDHDVLIEIADAEDALETIKLAQPESSFFVSVGNENYWLEETTREAQALPVDADGEELEAMIERLNEMSD